MNNLGQGLSAMEGKKEKMSLHEKHQRWKEKIDSGLPFALGIGTTATIMLVGMYFRAKGITDESLNANVRDAMMTYGRMVYLPAATVGAPAMFIFQGIEKIRTKRLEDNYYSAKTSTEYLPGWIDQEERTLAGWERSIDDLLASYASGKQKIENMKDLTDEAKKERMDFSQEHVHGILKVDMKAIEATKKRILSLKRQLARSKVYSEKMDKK
ncbi:hypothetical protein HYV44_00100 [Candidatus Microgenomates bacterium]|nr:hypothetical protein [Candidatus Microgenomates bacterium]